MDRGTVQPRLYPATIDGTIEGTPVFLTREELADKRRDQGPYVFGCLGASSLILMADWSLKPIHAVKQGDMVVGWSMVPGQRSKLVPTKVLATQNHRADTISVQMSGGWRIVCTPDHQWWSGRRKEDNGRRVYSPVGLEKSGLSSLSRVLDLNNGHNWPPHPEAKEAAAYLAGIFDGEGTVSGKCIHISQCERTHPQVCERIRRSLGILEFKWGEHRPKGREQQVDFYITGGRQEAFRFLLLCDPAKRKQVADSMFGARDFSKGAREPIASITPGERQMVYNIETETGNYIADGFCSKNCQMLQDPTADDKQGFKAEWLRYAGVTSRGHNLLILVDPASKKKPTSDYTSMWLIGLGPDRKVYVHDMLRDRLSLTQRAETLIKWHRYWSAKGPIQAVAYEEYGLQADIEHAQSRMEDENYRFEITPVGGRLGKLDRIRRLIPWFEQGRIYLPAAMTKTNYEGKSVDLVKAFKNEEYLAFPVAPHDDMLDALARFLDDDLPISFPLSVLEDDDRELEMVGGRNVTTGY
jgi:predicted phage terminase large subunit-like protein